MILAVKDVRKAIEFLDKNGYESITMQQKKEYIMLYATKEGAVGRIKIKVDGMEYEETSTKTKKIN